MKRRRWMTYRARKGRETSPVARLAGVTFAAAAGALLFTMIPSARRYLRMRAM